MSEFELMSILLVAFFILVNAGVIIYAWLTGDL